MTISIYILRTRGLDADTWSDPTYYRKRQKRDKDEKLARCLCGVGTWKYGEQKTEEEIAEIEFEDEYESN